MRILISLILISFSVFWLPASAQENCDPPSWEGRFYNNTDFQGTPVMTICRAVIDFDWQGGSPGPSVYADGFSSRWTSIQTFPNVGTYQFTVRVEDGVRLYVNGAPLINSMVDSPEPRTLNATYNVTSAGSTAFITLEMANFVGNSQLRLEWSLTSGGTAPQSNTQPNTQPNPPAPVTNNPTTTTQQQGATGTTTTTTTVAGGGEQWLVEYYEGTNLEGNPLATALAPADGISRNYGGGSPAPESIGQDNFSSRWVRQIDFVGGIYTFTLRADDSARVYINGTEILNQGEYAQGQDFTVRVQIPAGRHEVEVQHVELGGEANLFLTWDPPLGTTLLPDGCNAPETAGIAGGAPPCPDQSVVSFGGATTGATTPVTVATVRAGPLNFRESPTRNARPLAMISRGEQYSVLGRSSDNQWAQLVVDGQTGWAMVQFLTLPVDVSSLPDRENSLAETAPPSVMTAENGVAPQGDNQIQILEEDAIVATGDEGIETIFIANVRARALAHMRVRTGPSDDFDRVFGVAYWEEVNVLGISPDGLWFFVEKDGQTGWSNNAWYEIIEGTRDELPVMN